MSTLGFVVVFLESMVVGVIYETLRQRRRVRGQPEVRKTMNAFDVRANCPTCGDVNLNLNEVTVRFCVDDGRMSYTFICPSCGQRDERPCGWRIASLLEQQSVPFQSYTRAGPAPLNFIDLVDLTISLAQTDYLADEAAQ